MRIPLQPEGNENTNERSALGQGTHTVRLVGLKYIDSSRSGDSVQKVYANFAAHDGAEYVERLGIASAGQQKRLGAFLAHLCSIFGVQRPADIDPVDDLPKLLKRFNDTGILLDIDLAVEEYNGQSRVVFGSRFFSDCIRRSASKVSVSEAEEEF